MEFPVSKFPIIPLIQFRQFLTLSMMSENSDLFIMYNSHLWEFFHIYNFQTTHMAMTCCVFKKSSEIHSHPLLVCWTVLYFRSMLSLFRSICAPKSNFYRQQLQKRVQIFIILKAVRKLWSSHSGHQVRAKSRSTSQSTSPVCLTIGCNLIHTKTRQVQRFWSFKCRFFGRNMWLRY